MPAVIAWSQTPIASINAETLDGFATAMESINTLRDRPAGHLRLTVPRPAARTVIAPILATAALGVVIYILRTARNLRSIGWAIALGLLLGGATGNLLDRIFRAPGLFQGHVVDWIQLPDWPVFNLADSAIVCAGALVVLLALRGIRLDGTKPARESA